MSDPFASTGAGASYDDYNPFGAPAEENSSLLGGHSTPTSNPYSAPSQDFPSFSEPLPQDTETASMSSAPTTYGAPALAGDTVQSAAEVQELRLQLRKLEDENAYLKERVGNYKPPNWPSCWPVWYHNISEDVPVKHARNLTRAMYTSWFGFAFAQLVNFLAWLGILFSRAEAKDSGAGVSMAFLWILVAIPGSIALWYRQLYRFMKTNKSSSYLMFAIWFVVHCAFVTMMLIGLGSTGGGGFIIMVDMFKQKQSVVAFMFLTAFLLWSFSLLSSVITAFRCHRYYRSIGGNLADAKRELATDAAVASI